VHWIKFKVDSTFYSAETIELEDHCTLVIAKDPVSADSSLDLLRSRYPDWKQVCGNRALKKDKSFVVVYPWESYINHKRYLCGQYSTVYVEIGFEVDLAKVLARLREVKY